MTTTSHFSLRKTANRVELKGQTHSPPLPGAFDTQLRATPHKVALTLGKLTELSFTASPLKLRIAQWLEAGRSPASSLKLGGTFFQIHTDIYIDEGVRPEQDYKLEIRDSQNLAENEEQRNLRLQRLRENRSLEKVNPYEYKRKLNSKDMTDYKSLVTTLLVERQNRLQLLEQNAAMYRENKRLQHLQD